MGYWEEYKKKTITAKQAAALISSGMMVEYAPWTAIPYRFDKALGARAGEEGLRNVGVRVASAQRVLDVHACDPEAKTFRYGSWFFSGNDRAMAKTPRGAAYYVENYHEIPHYGSWEQFRHRWPDVFVSQVRPMDAHGFFNFGNSNSHNKAYASSAKIVIAEINGNLPHCFGGFAEGLNLDEIDYIIDEGDPPPVVVTPPPSEALPSEKKIAEQIVSRIPNGACLQLGIGNMPNTIGTLLAESDLRDLGVQSEMFCEAYVSLYEAGKITGRYKETERYKSAYTFALGTQRLYDFMNENQNLASCPVDYLNDPARIRLNPNQTSINNLLEIDLFTQVCSETSGIRQISGTGGQLDFSIGAYESDGGQNFLAFNSTYTDSQGKVHSRVRPTLSGGGIVTVPRTVVHWLVTEYGMVNVKGMSNWERAEAVISIAHPDFRDGLIREADKMGIWRPSNKIR